MTNTELKGQIDSQITSKTLPNSITPTILGGNVKSVVDYIDQQAPIKNSATVTLSGTTQVLPNDINSVNSANGKAYLPSTTVIGRQILVIANANGIEISANVAGTLKMFVTFNTFIANVVMAQYEMYRFTYIGFGSGAGSTIDGYWKAEKLQ